MRRLSIIVSLFAVFGLFSAACGDANLEEVLADIESSSAANPATTSSLTTDTTANTDATTTTASSTDTSPPPDDDDEPIDPPATDPAAEGEIAGAPVGIGGTRDNPVPAGSTADLGNGWRVQVLGATDDATQEILTENQFNDPPPAGSRFMLVRVAIGYFGTEDPVDWWDINISAVANGLELSSDCGVIPDDKPFGDAYAGAVWEGNICFVADGPRRDVVLYAEEFFSFDSERVFMVIDPEIGVSPIRGLFGPQPDATSTPGRIRPNRAGTAVDISSEWQLTVSNGRVGTREVLALNQFNDPPPAGYDFYLVDIAAQYNGDETGSIYDLGITGVTDSNVGLESWCGTHPNDFEFGLEAFPGGTLEGTHCVVVPSAEVDSLVIDITVSFDFDNNHAFFAPN